VEVTLGFWDRMTAPIRAMVRRRDEPIRYYQWVSADAPSGIVITAEAALQISVVWACVMAITNAIASCRWNVFNVAASKREWLPDDPVDYLLNVRPNPDMTAISYKESLLFAALTYGNGYAEIIKNGRGQPTALWPMLPDRTIPRRRTEKPYPLYYEYHQMDGTRVELAAEDVFHLRGPGITGLMGDNLVARAAKSMGLFAAQERFAATFFGNNTLMGGILETAGKLSPDAHKRLKDDWEDRYKGPFKANRPAILEGGMKWTPQQVEADKAQMTESRQYQVEEICRWYGVPPHKVQHLLRSTFNNIEHLGIEFARDALTPWALRLEQEADFKLFPQRAPLRSTKLDMGWLTHGDAKSRFEAYQIGRNIGVWSANDILGFEGKNGIGSEGDVRIVPMNFTTLDAMANTPKDALVKKSASGDGGGAGDGDSQPGQGDEGAGGTETGADKGDSGNSDARNAVMGAVHMELEGALGRYSRVMQNRAADLRRRELAEAKVVANLAEERQKQRPRLIEECRSALDLAAKWLPGAANRDRDVETLKLADAVDNSVAPGQAAMELLERWNR
jgi:HK97 family phage portal protein